ncbi:receptor-like protein Cf-9 [Solanum stenotomum]|uniref:receptor-like protein Cf-9 n=1 Tax=Solanum stenotomum TaxID=172797 RepID=UPI0020D182F1|nr:receptor-like protein Cf-9 [Solanum stenotomum]
MGYAVMLLIVFLCHEVSSISILPHKHQIISLLKFKQSFTIDTSAVIYNCPKPYPKTSSWNMSRDCCSWDGVVCDDITGHVIELDLGCSGLVGTIDSNSSLFQLSHLQRLDLSSNNFSNSQISPEFGKFSSLMHLDLSNSYFSGQIPSEISHLSKLHSLSLSGTGTGSLRLVAHDFKLLLQNLTQLRELDLTFINISSTIPLNFSSHLTTLDLGFAGLYGIIPENIFHLSNLEALYLENNDQLSGHFPKIKWNSSASLIVLDLLGVNFSDNLPEYIGYLTSLRYLYLQSCNLRGPIPESISNLTRIEHLFLHDNSLNGTIPSGVFSLPSLTYLILASNHFTGQLEDFKSNSLIWIHVGGNQLQGHLPNSIQNLVNLTKLGLSFNNFSGRVDVSFFSDLKQLYYLTLSYNNISLTNDNNVTLPESLTELELAACEVKELEFLRSANQLRQLDLSNNKIQGRIPDWAWSNWMSSLDTLNMSHNMLTSVDSIPLQSLYTIDLRSNLLQGSLPIPSNSTRYFFISHNNLTGEIPSSICNLTSLVMLDLATNSLRGEIPQCFGNITSLQVLDMRHNNLSGNIPTTFSNGSSLTSLNLHGNRLEGTIPPSLAHCKELQVLDLGDNHLIGTFPMWLGTLPNLKVISLRFNELHGPIRALRIENMFPELRIIDLSYNAFSGNLHSSLFQHLKAMRTSDPSMEASSYGRGRYYQDSIRVATKGFDREIVRILYLYTVIDLSSNKFDGQIPSIVGDLIAVRILNLSHNGLQGHIPQSFGDLSSVESLDLSRNQLSGEIPHQLASLTSLSFLNLSHNHLQGCIPQGPQSHTFERNSFEGNDGLRGFPVSRSCTDDRVLDTNDTVSGQLDDEESNSEFQSDFWKAALMGYGSGLCIGISIVYFMMSTGKPIWFARIIVKLEHKIMMRRRKKQRRQTNCRRRNNH